MKTTVTIYKGSELIAKQYCRSKKEEEAFINAHKPKMTMEKQITEQWHIYRSY